MRLDPRIELADRIRERATEVRELVFDARRHLEVIDTPSIRRIRSPLRIGPRRRAGMMRSVHLSATSANRARDGQASA
jgi:hypothetical protein